MFLPLTFRCGHCCFLLFALHNVLPQRSSSIDPCCFHLLTLSFYSIHPFYFLLLTLLLSYILTPTSLSVELCFCFYLPLLFTTPPPPHSFLSSFDPSNCLLWPAVFFCSSLLLSSIDPYFSFYLHYMFYMFAVDPRSLSFSVLPCCFLLFSLLFSSVDSAV